MEQTLELPMESRPRLKFIDMARSIAILMMLEGHFTGAALSSEYRSDSFLLYNIWHNIHGLTSPLFFTVTGVIFVYLLSSNNSISYFKNIRVKKGFKRVFQLIFWGYFIQLNIWSIVQSIYYQSEFHFDWLYAFHVLQSIGVGIFFLLAIYGIYKWINKGYLYWYYLVAGIIIFTFYGMMKSHINEQEKLITDGIINIPKYIPSGFPKFIQNMFYGQYSDFSFIRYSGYTILGGMLGSIIRINEDKAKKWWFGTSFIVAGILLGIFAQPIFRNLDSFIEYIGLTNQSTFEFNNTAFARFGQVVSVLGILMLIDKFWNVQAKLFLKIGQNTLPIYIVHVIILYGGIFGFGLKPYAFDMNLNPYVSFLVSVTFILFFTIMVKYIEPLERLYSNFINLFSFKKQK